MDLMANPGELLPINSFTTQHNQFKRELPAASIRGGGGMEWGAATVLGTQATLRIAQRDAVLHCCCRCSTCCGRAVGTGGQHAQYHCSRV